MPARALYFSSFLFTLIVFPFVVFNVLLTKTSLLPNAKSFVISTGSMEPAIPVGSIIYTMKKSEYRVGEIIAFLKGKGVVSHRVVGTTMVGNNKYYLTKGDANNGVDEDLVQERSIYGKIVTFIPEVGKIILFYKNPFGIILGTVLPTLLFLVTKIIPYSY